jgi:oligopeptide/dipeptide ABC transporter ATP-binding protein
MSPEVPRPVTAAGTGFDAGAGATVILRATDVCKDYQVRVGPLARRRLHAVNQVSLAVRRGETLGIVGESGSGKSTLARLLAGLAPATAGSVEFDGHPVDATDRRAHRQLTRHVQIVFQDPFASLNPWMTVGQTISRPLVVHRLGDRQARRRQVAELLDAVGLPASAAEKLPHQFSGGQRQRIAIAIARALAPRPRVVIADEVTSALDVSVQATILNLLRDLQRGFGLTYVMVTHDLRVARHMSDQVAVMHLGRVVEQGPAGTVLGQPRHPYTMALLDSLPGRRERPTGPERVQLAAPVSALDPPSGCAFHPQCPFACVPNAEGSSM